MMSLMRDPLRVLSALVVILCAFYARILSNIIEILDRAEHHASCTEEADHLSFCGDSGF